MSTFNVKNYLLIFFICASLTIQKVSAIPPQDLSGDEPCEPYISALFIFFCIATIFSAFLHQYYLQEPEKPSVTRAMSEEELLQELQEKINLILKNNQEKTF